MTIGTLEIVDHKLPVATLLFKTLNCAVETNVLSPFVVLRATWLGLTSIPFTGILNWYETPWDLFVTHTLTICVIGLLS